MTANLDHQHDGIWNQLKRKPLGTPGRDFLDEITRSRRTLDVYSSFWWQLSPGTQKKGAFALRLLALTLVGKFICLVVAAFLCGC